MIKILYRTFDFYEPCTEPCQRPTESVEQALLGSLREVVKKNGYLTVRLTVRVDPLEHCK